MVKSIKTYLAFFLPLLLTIAAVALFVVEPVSAQGSIWEGLTRGAELTDPDGGAVNPQDRISDIVSTIINIFSLVVGVISVIMIIIGGLKYIMSGGDSGNVTAAKNTILYAIIGLVIVALSQIIVRFVLETLAGI